MMNAYSELYLDDAMENLGSMVDYAVGECGLPPDEFMNRFISSGIAARFEKGNPKYVAVCPLFAHKKKEMELEQA